MRTRTAWGRANAAMFALLAGGIPLITIASCDPRSGTFDFYRNTNSGDYADWGYSYDDCWYYCDYGYDDYFVFDW